MIDFVRFQTKNEPVLWTPNMLPRQLIVGTSKSRIANVGDRASLLDGRSRTELVGATTRRQTEYDSDVRLSLHIRGCVSQRGVARHRIRRRCNRTSRRFTPVFGTDVRISGV